MADQFKTDAHREHVQAGSFGNVSSTRPVERNLNGAANGDQVFFMKIPRGSTVFDSLFQLTGTDGGAGATMKLGLIAVTDGEKGDDDFFNEAKALDGGNAIHRRDNAAATPLYLDDDDYFVVGTVGGADVGDNDKLATVNVVHEFTGNL